MTFQKQLVKQMKKGKIAVSVNLVTRGMAGTALVNNSIRFSPFSSHAFDDFNYLELHAVAILVFIIWLLASRRKERLNRNNLRLLKNNPFSPYSLCTTLRLRKLKSTETTGSVAE